MATTSNDVTSQSILNTILADVNALLPNFTSLVNSYRLLVGSAEEIHRMPGVTNDVYARSIERFDRCGLLIDIVIDLLCCKIGFSSDFLAITCGPVDIIRLLANRCDVADTPREVAEEILLLEVLRRAQERLRCGSGAPPCTPPGPPPYVFPTSFFVPPPPPPPPIPPEPPLPPPCFVPPGQPTQAVPAAPPTAQAEAAAEILSAAVAADENRKRGAGPPPAASCRPLRPRNLKK